MLSYQHRCLWILLLIFSLSLTAEEYDGFDDFQSSLEDLEEIFNGDEDGNACTYNECCATPTNVVDVDMPIPLTSLEYEPSSMVHNCINVITGQFCESSVDLVLYHGTQPLVIERSFLGGSSIEGNIVSGWGANHDSLTTKVKEKGDNKRLLRYALDEGNGQNLVFEKQALMRSGPSHIMSLVPKCYQKGVTNTSRGYISGQSNIKNYVIKEHENRQGKRVLTAITGAGQRRFYNTPSDHHPASIKKHIEPNGMGYSYATVIYKHLTTQQKSQRRERKQKTINLINRASKCRGKVFRLYDEEYNFKTLTQDGRFVLYKEEPGPRKYSSEKILTVDSSDAPRQRLLYDSSSLYEKRLPDHRFLQASYENIPSLQNSSCVKSLMAPAGTTKEAQTIYSFDYEKNQCVVTDARKNRTVYAIDDNKRITSVEKFAPNSQEADFTEQLFWGETNSSLETQLLTRIVKTKVDGEGFARTYKYDIYGNVTEECLYANLSGHNKSLPRFWKSSVVNKNNSECYKKKYVYSSQMFNLLLEETDGFSKTTYQYIPGTNLLTAKLEGDDNRYYRRSFYTYGAEAAIVKEIQDDGYTDDPNDLTGVTERHITYYTISDTYPAGYPILIEKKCLDLTTGEELPLTTIQNTYNNLGKITHQVHYDSLGAQAFELFWSYDAHGNLVEEVDALGRTVKHAYDANDNRIQTIHLSTGVKTKYTYDFMNRLVKEDTFYPKKQRQTCSYEYDLMGNCTASIDKNGNKTSYVHDPFGRISKITCPAVVNANNKKISPKTSREYDLMGNVVKEIDGRGLVTEQTFTIRGQLASVTYPDGTTEKNIYHYNGMLRQHVDKNGLITKYTHDALGRVIKTETVSPSGRILAKTSATYSGFHVLTETDAAGTTTTYAYYPNGKLKSKQRDDFLTTYEYDAMGRLVKTCEFTDDSFSKAIVYAKELDVAGRVVEERIENEVGSVLKKTSYVYDLCDQLIETINYGEKGPAVTKMFYDGRGKLVKTVDPLGNKIITRYTYDYCNELGQIVNYQEVTDPLGKVTITICDALDRVVTMICKNSLGEVIQKKNISYDLKGNVVKIADVVIAPDASERIVVAKMVYNNTNQLIASYEAVGTPEQTQTNIFYNAYGQKEKTIRNDGSSLSYTYDDWGQLATLTSSDGSVSYRYHYDRLHNLTKVDDLVNNTTTTRTYNNKNQITQEVLANGLTMNYVYDAIGRPTQVDLPDRSSILYAYNGNFLSDVQRVDASGEIRYTHKYDAYDQQGQQLSSVLVGDAGTVHYTYDLLGRLTSAETKAWSESLTYDALGNLIGQALKDSWGSADSSYEYDPLDQLKKESGVTTQSYTCDSIYNRLEKNGQRCQVNALNQLLDDEQYTYSYDDNGNLVKKSSSGECTDYSYDALDRLISVQKGDRKWCYTYDSEHRRLSKTEYTLVADLWIQQGSPIRYLYHGQNEIGAVDEAGNLVELRVLGVGKGAEIGASIAIEIGTQVYAPVHDHNGNLACLLDSRTGEIVESYRYTAFGEELFDEALVPWRFSSKRVDDESGLIYFGRRYYMPETGCWISQDPIGREGGPNLYAYVQNNPLTHYDLYGLFGEGFSSFYQNSGLQSFVGGIANMGAKICSTVGYALQQAAFHFLPIPGVKDVVEMVGYRMQGYSKADYRQLRMERKSDFLYYPGHDEGNPSNRHVLYNGICNSRQDVIDRCAEISEQNGWATVYGIFNGSNGAVLDLVEVMCQKVGISTEMQRFSQAATQYLANQIPNGRLIAEAHSQGAETVYNLCPHLRKMMEVHAYGPARILFDKDFLSAINHVTTYDPVPWIADPFGVIKGLCSKEVHFEETVGCPLFAHCWSKNNYGRFSKNLGDDYKQKNGWIEVVR